MVMLHAPPCGDDGGERDGAVWIVRAGVQVVATDPERVAKGVADDGEVVDAFLDLGELGGGPVV